MTINILAVNGVYCNSQNVQRNKNKEFPELRDPISEAIRKNVKDPVDREEDLRFWKTTCDSGIKFKKENPTYEDFLDLKKNIVSFPPQTAPGRVRKAYREYMNRLPKNVRDEMQGILTVTYGLFIAKNNMRTCNWGQILGIMKEHVGEIGDIKTTNFDLLSQILNDCDTFDKDSKEDESVRQILI